MFGLEILAVSSLLHLAGGPVKCTLPQAPRIVVSPQSDPVRYVYNLGSGALGQMPTDTVNPYGAGVDTATGGLRKDAPTFRIQAHIGYQQWPALGVFCMYYDRVRLDIHLKPTIYIAREYGPGPCREAILEHERKHVRVDREIMNKYAGLMGRAVQDRVDSIGVVGPFKISQLQQMQDLMIGYVSKTVEAQEKALQAEMRQRQAAVDSLQEYEQVGAICRR